jgi:hypothetical protein
MKIRKVKKIEGAIVLNNLANSLANANLDTSDDPLSSFSNLGYRRQLAVLDPENVEPIFKYEKVFRGSKPTADYMNRACSSIHVDIQALFGISGSLGNALIEGNNLIVEKEKALLDSIRELRSSLGTLRLYSGKGSSSNAYKSYSFERQAELLPLASGAAECSIYPAAGCLTLPRLSSSEAESIKISSIIIGENSSNLGSSNLASSYLSNSALTILQDKNEQTWIEYEGEGNEPCKLILEVNFSKPEIINKIIIRPVNFGTRSWVEITDIRASVLSSGSSEAEISIKDELISPEWNVDSLSLSSANSSDPSIGEYLFSPKTVRRVVLTFSKNAEDEAEGKIGIRELSFHKVGYESEGEFALQPVDFGISGKSVLAAGILHNFSQRKAGVTEVTYSISPDSGETWHKVTALTESNTDIGEVTDFLKPSSKLMIKGKIKRSKDSFKNSDRSKTLITEKLTAAPLLTSAIILDEEPVSHLEVVELGVGTVGSEFPPTKVGEGVAPNGVYTRYPLPYAISKWKIKVLVDGVYWGRTDSFTDTTSLRYIYDDSSVAPRLIFGHGVAPDGGRAVPPGASISVYTDSELLKVSGNPEGGYKVDLKLPSARSINMTKVFQIRGLGVYLSKTTLHTLSTSWEGLSIQSIRAGSSLEINLSKDKLYLKSELTSGSGNNISTWASKDFINGVSELSGQNNAYSIDGSEGRLYLSDLPPVAADGSIDLKVKLGYLQKIEVSNISFIQDSDSFSINDNVYSPSVVDYKIHSRDGSFKTLTTGNNTHSYLVIDAPVLKGSLSLRKTTGEFADAMKVEVGFIDGVTEFEALPVSVRDQYYSVQYGTNILGEVTGEISGENNGIIGDLPRNAGAAIHRYSGFEPLRSDQDRLNGTIKEDPENGFTFLSSDLIGSYRMGLALRKSVDFTQEGSSVTVSPSWILEGRNREMPERAVLTVYDVLSSPLAEDELEEFYTPVLKDLALIGATVDPRLAKIASV